MSTSNLKNKWFCFRTLIFIAVLLLGMTSGVSAYAQYGGGPSAPIGYIKIPVTGSPTTGNLFTCSNVTYKSLSDLIFFFVCIIQRFLIPIMMTLAVVLFIFGIALFILHAENEESRENGKKFMLWSIIAIFVMVSIWAIIAFLGTTVGFRAGGVKAIIPQLKL